MKDRTPSGQYSREPQSPFSEKLYRFTRQQLEVTRECDGYVPSTYSQAALSLDPREAERRARRIESLKAQEAEDAVREAEQASRKPKVKAKRRASTPFKKRQNAFVEACLQGNLELMQRLRDQGAELDVPNGKGQYPLRSCLESLNMQAIQWLGSQIEAHGHEAWRRIQLEDLEQWLNSQKPSELRRTCEYDGTMYPTWVDLAEWYRTNGKTIKMAYDMKYGVGRYEIDAKAAIAGIAWARGGEQRPVDADRVEGVTNYMSVAKAAVLEYVFKTKAAVVDYSSVGP